jgi:two-component system response regulator CpxR
MAQRLLIVDDDTELTRLLTELLGHEGFEVEALGAGSGAAERATSGAYALAILDVMLPDTNGFEILKDIRSRSSLPVILLTARGDDVDRIVGLEIGADDYVPKPFNPRELTARIRAVLRRTEPRVAAGRVVVEVDDVVLDPAARVVHRAGQAVELTSVEFDILRALLESAGETVARATIVETVLGRRFDAFDRSVDMHISNLRKKLGPRADGDDRIKTIRSVGYIYARPPAAR